MRFAVFGSEFGVRVDLFDCVMNDQDRDSGSAS